MQTKYLLIAGAGCTLSDATTVPKRKKPPLDKGFFHDISLKEYYPEFTIVSNYLQKTYDFDPTEPTRDSLESVMAIIYADIHNSNLGASAVSAFRDLIKLFNKRVAETTNDLIPTNRFNLYRILCHLIDKSITPKEICIITFNQDVQIEKVLQKIQSTNRIKKCGRVFNFPYCYGIPDSVKKLSRPTRVYQNSILVMKVKTEYVF